MKSTRNGSSLKNKRDTKKRKLDVDKATHTLTPAKTINELPSVFNIIVEDTLVLILGYLDKNELYWFAQVCSAFRDFLSRPSVIEKALFDKAPLPSFDFTRVIYSNQKLLPGNTVKNVRCLQNGGLVFHTTQGYLGYMPMGYGSLRILQKPAKYNLEYRFISLINHRYLIACTDHAINIWDLKRESNSKLQSFVHSKLNEKAEFHVRENNDIFLIGVNGYEIWQYNKFDFSAPYSSGKIRSLPYSNPLLIFNKIENNLAYYKVRDSSIVAWDIETDELKEWSIEDLTNRFENEPIDHSRNYAVFAGDAPPGLQILSAPAPQLRGFSTLYFLLNFDDQLDPLYLGDYPFFNWTSQNDFVVFRAPRYIYSRWNKQTNVFESETYIEKTIKSINNVAISPEGNVAAVYTVNKSVFRHLLIWHYETKKIKTIQLDCVERSSSSPISGVSWLPSGDLLCQTISNAVWKPSMRFTIYDAKTMQVKFSTSLDEGVSNFLLADDVCTVTPTGAVLVSIKKDTRPPQQVTKLFQFGVWKAPAVKSGSKDETTHKNTYVLG